MLNIAFQEDDANFIVNIALLFHNPTSFPLDTALNSYHFRLQVKSNPH